MRHELRGGTLPQATRERIGLAVAERRGDPYSIAQHARTARAAGLGLDEVSRARSFDSARSQARRRCSPSSRRCSRPTAARPSTSPRRRARHGWTDEELLEAVAHLAMNEFQSLIANAAALPAGPVDSAVLPDGRLAAGLVRSPGTRVCATADVVGVLEAAARSRGRLR